MTPSAMLPRSRQASCAVILQGVQGKSLVGVSYVHRTRLVASTALIAVFVLVALPGLHPDGGGHHAAADAPAFSADLDGWAHAPGCALCRVTSQLRSALQGRSQHDRAVVRTTRLALWRTAELAPGAPVQRGMLARAPPSA